MGMELIKNNMINIQTSNEIIKYRALGFSYDDIVELSKVSKPVIIKICKERQMEIEDSKKYASSQTNMEIKEAIINRKIIYNTLLYKVSSEIMKRDLSTMKVNELATLIGSLEKSLNVLEGNNLNKTTNTPENVSDKTLAKMALAVIGDELRDDIRQEVEIELKTHHDIAN